MLPRIFSLEGKNGNVTVHYTYNMVRLDAHHDQDNNSVGLMENESDLERSLAVAELLIAIDEEVNKKLLAATPSTP